MTTKIADQPIHLGLGATSVIQPAFTGEMTWYGDYVERHGGDGAEGRLVSMYTFTKSWDVWEMHPKGSEVVLCTAGAITLVQEAVDGAVVEVTLAPGEYAINEPGVWHTADIADSGTAVFITAGQDTEHRPR